MGELLQARQMLRGVIGNAERLPSRLVAPKVEELLRDAELLALMMRSVHVITVAVGDTNPGTL